MNATNDAQRVPPVSGAQIATDDERPSGVRHLVVAVTVAMAVVLYLDRFCVNISERYIKEDLGLTETQVAFFISAFFWAYALAQVPAGFLGDRAGIRNVLAGYILLWSLFTGLIGLAQGAVMLLAMRVGCGLAQAGAFPASGSLLRRWVPFQSRGMASGLVALGGRLGAVIAPILTAYLMVWFVPLSTPATLTDSQILAPQALVQKLVPSAKTPGEPIQSFSPAAARVFAVLSATDQQHLTQLASADSQTTESASIGEQVAKILNRALAEKTLYSDAAMGTLSLSEEAVGFLKRSQAGETLTDAESLRLNRLVLEAAFRNEIGKLYVRGWRPVLIVYGIAGIAVAFLFWFIFRDWPGEHPWCNSAEQRLIAGPLAESVTPGSSRSRHTPLPMRGILTSRGLWLSSISQFGTNVAWLFLLTSLPRYLIEVHEVPILKRSFMVSLLPLAGVAGMFLGGRLTDWLVGKIGLRWGRALPMGLTRFGIAAAYLACLTADSAWWAVGFLACAFFCVDLGVGAVWAYMQDVGGKHVGSILGWGNMWGNIGAAVAPQLYNLILGEHPTIAQWNTLFVVCALAAVVSGVAALLIDARQPIQGLAEA
ncbi:MAG: MFS transporter [Planctomycetaceae bacterium]|nr:MAG: MFS transporter [Planctomycetaceae bacterium]